LSRTPKPDEHHAPAANDAGDDQSWLADAAQDLTSQVDAALKAVLDGGEAAGGEVEAPIHADDGLLPLVLDAQELASVDATFDSLANSADLFDVPSVDSVGDSSGAADGASGA
jgi:hypothetical protein